MAVWEFWLTDDSGQRLLLLDDIFFASISKSTSGLGTLELALSYQSLKSKMSTVFRPDWRVECWRSAATGIPMRRERTYLVREPIIYTRETDSIEVLKYQGRDGMDLLGRRVVVQGATTSFASKTDHIDDVMKAIVREQMLYGSCVDETGTLSNTRAYPQGEFVVDADMNLGPSISKTFNDRNVLDVLKELRDASISLHDINGSKQIYFDVVESQIPGTNRFGWTFRTYANLRGADRTNGIEFSVENENLKTPTYSKDHKDEVNAVYVRGNTSIVSVTDPTRVASSRWNRSEGVRFGYYAGVSGLTSIGYDELTKGKPYESLDAIFLNVPENQNTPRSLYGVDWDFGDLLRVNYAGIQFDCEVKIVYLSVDEQGRETITGRNKVGS